MNIIAALRRKIVGEVFDYQVLMDCLSGYRKPRDAVSRLLADGMVVRIKKGLYCFGEPYRRNPVSREYLANLIYGPSYVSLDYALYYHGMIPERVNTVTSVTTRRSWSFDTPAGSFTYRMLRGSRYPVGALLESTGATTFLLAAPEKALVDKVWTDKRFSGTCVPDYEEYLFDDLRIAEDNLVNLDGGLMDEISAAYDSAKIRNLIAYLKRLGRDEDA